MFLTAFTILSVLLLGLLATKVVVFVTLCQRHHTRHRRRLLEPTASVPTEKVSVIVPCYNEQKVILNCIDSLRAQAYQDLEIILVDDGSTDRTADLIAEAAEAYDNVRSFTKPNGGKASALNLGIERAHGSIVVCMDADSMLLPDAVQQLVGSFTTPDIAAVGGNVRVANRDTVLGAHQAVEYISGLALQRRAFAHLGCMQVISGAIGAFRRDDLLAAGGYSTDTIVEDMDITVTLHRHGHRVVYNPDAIAYTEAPERVSDFLKQRYRWTFGNFQVVAKHRDMLFNPTFGPMGKVGLPYAAIFPWIDAFISVLLVVAVGRAALTGDGIGLLLFFVVMITIQASLSAYALTLDRQPRRLAAMAAVESLCYTHLINVTTIRAGVNYVRGRSVEWNKLERLGKNVISPRVIVMPVAKALGPVSPPALMEPAAP